MKTSQIVVSATHAIAGIILLISGLKFIFGWDWGTFFTSFLIALVGAYLLISSKIKNVNLLKRSGANWKKYLKGLGNLGMFGSGLVLLFMAISIPFLNLPISIGFYGWTLIIGGILTILDMFNII